MTSGVLESAEAWPVDHLAVGATRADDVVESFGDTGETFAWASVSKLVSALAVVMAVDQDIVSLDDPAGPEGSTVAHLLAHASGLPMNGDDAVAEPGERRIYSNTGFEVLADVVEERTGIGFTELVEENVFEPLGMSGSRLEGSPAHGVSGPLADLLALGRELLRPTLVSEEMFADATSVAFEGLSGVLPGFGRQDPNDWGLGFEIRDGKDPHWTGSRNSPATFGHFGQSGSFLWVDPEAGLACASLGDRDFGDWAKEAWPPLSDAVLEAYA